MINKAILVGNLGVDPEVRRLESGTTVANFRIATNENYMDNNGEWQTITEWHNIVCWRGLAERVERNLKKGNQVYVEGKITTRKWQDKDGNDRYNTDIVANIVRKLGRKEGGANPNFPSAADEPMNLAGQTMQQPTMQQPTNQNPSPVKDFSNDTSKEDDLPF